MKLILFGFVVLLAIAVVKLGKKQWDTAFPKEKKAIPTIEEIDEDIDLLNKKIEVLEKDVNDGIKSSEEKLYKFKDDLKKALELRRKLNKQI